MLVKEAVTTGRWLAEVRAAMALETLRRVDRAAVAVRADDRAAAAQLLGEVVHGTDAVTAIMAVHALAATGDVEADETLVDLLADRDSVLAEHAAWALASTPVLPPALTGLTGLVRAGGLPGALAQRTLERWAAQEPALIRDALVASFPQARDDGPRTRLVETLGLVVGDAVTALLRAVADDEGESAGPRAAAVAALGDGADPSDPEVRATLAALADAEVPVGSPEEPLASVARLALQDLDGRRSSSEPPHRAEGLTVAQLFLHADIDGSLLSAEQGDTGGIATLLVHLGDALLDAPGPVTRVLTISRGTFAGLDPAVLDPTTLDRPGHHYLPVPIWGPYPNAAGAWPLRVAVRRAMRRILRLGGVDVLHLRTADVASWAGAEAARELGIPVVVTLAPDPHALVASREAEGRLTRTSFGAADRAEHLVFRVGLLRELQEQAAHLVVFPRPELAADLRDLLDLHLALEGQRTSVVAEGVDLLPLDRASRAVRAASRGEEVPLESAAALGALDAVLATLPPHRRDLSLAITVGRLHRVKGTATLVATWADRPELADRCNLLVVGGGLERPTADEQEQLDGTAAIVRREDGSRQGLLLTGHRPKATVAIWLAAARVGRVGLCAPAGVHVSASLKEEFGIAILEAMASGLVVVAPREGGPATYVEDGVTGILVDTRSRPALAGAVLAALDLAAAPGADDRAATARDLVGERFGIETMAGALTAIYEDVAR